jgi:hypothetical protein
LVPEIGGCVQTTVSPTTTLREAVDELKEFERRDEL